MAHPFVVVGLYTLGIFVVLFIINAVASHYERKLKFETQWRKDLRQQLDAAQQDVESLMSSLKSLQKSKELAERDVANVLKLKDKWRERYVDLNNAVAHIIERERDNEKED